MMSNLRRAGERALSAVPSEEQSSIRSTLKLSPCCSRPRRVVAMTSASLRAGTRTDTSERSAFSAVRSNCSRVLQGRQGKTRSPIHPSAASETSRIMRAGLLCPGGVQLQSLPRNHQPGFFEAPPLQLVVALGVQCHFFWPGVVAIHGIVPTFDIQVRIVTGAEQGMHDLRPVALAEPGKTMLG